MGKKAIFIRIDGIYYFRNALSISLVIDNVTTMCFQEDKFYIQKENEEDMVQIDIIIYKDSVKEYKINSKLLRDGNIPFIGFKANEFVKNLSKMGKSQVYDIILNKCSSKTIRLVESNTGKDSSVGIIQTDIQDNEDLEEYLNGGYNIKVDVKDLSSFFSSIKTLECTSATVIAYPTYMKIKGLIEKEPKISLIFGNKETYYYCEDDEVKYPIKYKISQKYISMMTKLHTITPGCRAEIFFFKNKLVIKSGLNTNGSLIIKFKKE